MLVSGGDRAHVLLVLQPIWTTGTETDTWLRGRIEVVLNWATLKRYQEGENPARWRGHMAQLLAPPRKVAKVEILCFGL